MPEITLPQGTIRYREQGPADGPAVVFVHGFLVDGSLWDATAGALAARGFRTLAPDLPLGSHRVPMPAGADQSPRGLARLIAAFLAARDLEDATLVGNDTGGALIQYVLDTDPARVGRVVFTNCDAFETFPPRPFDLIFRAARHPALFLPLLQAMRVTALRHSPLGLGLLVKRPLDAVKTRAWFDPYLEDAAIRRDTAAFCRAVDPPELAGVATRLRRFEGCALLCWAPADRFFTIELGRRLAACFADARLVEIPDARTVVPHDQPLRLAEEIASFVRAPVAA